MNRRTMKTDRSGASELTRAGHRVGTEKTTMAMKTIPRVEAAVIAVEISTTGTNLNGTTTTSPADDRRLR
jgi:hypothetical protein